MYKNKEHKANTIIEKQHYPSGPYGESSMGQKSTHYYSDEMHCLCWQNKKYKIIYICMTDNILWQQIPNSQTSCVKAKVYSEIQ